MGERAGVSNISFCRIGVAGNRNTRCNVLQFGVKMESVSVFFSVNDMQFGGDLQYF